MGAMFAMTIMTVVPILPDRSAVALRDKAVPDEQAQAAIRWQRAVGQHRLDQHRLDQRRRGAIERDHDDGRSGPGGAAQQQRDSAGDS